MYTKDVCASFILYYDRFYYNGVIIDVYFRCFVDKLVKGYYINIHKNIILKTAIINNNIIIYPFCVNVIIELLMTATY